MSEARTGGLTGACLTGNGLIDPGSEDVDIGGGGVGVGGSAISAALLDRCTVHRRTVAIPLAGCARSSPC
jgi:hypothetical protein